jgi:hypothetical protein
MLEVYGRMKYYILTVGDTQRLDWPSTYVFPHLYSEEKQKTVTVDEFVRDHIHRFTIHKLTEVSKAEADAIWLAFGLAADMYGQLEEIANKRLDGGDNILPFPGQ